MSPSRDIRLGLVGAGLLALLCILLIILGRVYDQQLVTQTGVTILPMVVVFLLFAASMKWHDSKVRAGLNRDLINKKLLIFNGVLWGTMGCTWLGLAVSYDTKVRVGLGVIYAAGGVALLAKAAGKKRAGEG